jgi:hypothetical protein
MSDDTDSADRPALKPSEIEVTPEMIEAGRDVVIRHVGDLIPAIGGEARDLALDVYLAMKKIERGSLTI